MDVKVNIINISTEELEHVEEINYDEIHLYDIIGWYKIGTNNQCYTLLKNQVFDKIKKVKFMFSISINYEINQVNLIYNEGKKMNFYSVDCDEVSDADKLFDLFNSKILEQNKKGQFFHFPKQK